MAGEGWCSIDLIWFHERESMRLALIELMRGCERMGCGTRPFRIRTQTIVERGRTMLRITAIFREE